MHPGWLRCSSFKYSHCVRLPLAAGAVSVTDWIRLGVNFGDLPRNTLEGRVGVAGLAPGACAAAAATQNSNAKLTPRTRMIPRPFRKRCRASTGHRRLCQPKDPALPELCTDQQPLPRWTLKFMTGGS
jgi:hypothetical protein